MMPLYLNLLSPSKKTKLITLVKFFYIKEILETIVFTTALLGIAFVLAWFMLTLILNNLAASSLLITRENTTRNQEIRATNAVFKEVNRAGEGFMPLVPKLSELIDAAPADIRISSLDIDRSKPLLLIAGTAQTRSALLNFQSALEKISWIKEVSVPRSQLLQKENINFELQAAVEGFLPLPPYLKAPANRNSSNAPNAN